MGEARQSIAEFLERGPFAVVGASEDRTKYGNKVLRAYIRTGLEVWPVHPRAPEVEGLPAYPSLADLPGVPRSISVITPPRVTEEIVDEAVRLGVEFVWMQPGAESDAAVARARAAGLRVIAGGPCFLVETGFRE
jgi:predicted CoA-binding protein